MAGIIVILLQLILPLLIIAVAMLTGRTIERRHFRKLEREEATLSSIVVSDIKTIPPDWEVEESFLVVGSVVRTSAITVGEWAVAPIKARAVSFRLDADAPPTAPSKAVRCSSQVQHKSIGWGPRRLARTGRPL